jgi:xanthine dehydrogenase accessory factor
MDLSTDTEVLNAALQWLDAGDPVYLATVASTWGSSPRRPGALMVIHPDGRFIGSVSGGCVEDDLVQQVLRGDFESTPPRLLEYGITREATQRVGLPCGGRLSLVLERIDAAQQLRTLLEVMETRQQIERRVCLTTGETSLHPAKPGQNLEFDGTTLIKTFGPRWRLLIVGAGELSRRVAQLALTLEYAITLCDPRPEYAQDWHVAGTDFVTTAPAEAIAALQPDKHTAVLALSHTPAIDDDALATALISDAFYVGALGSRKNQDARRKRLQKQGLTTEQLARLDGPAGLAIGSRSPAEIAISIAASLIAERHRQHLHTSQSQLAHA